MKQYTTPEQTAKLIELGFEQPKSIEVYRDGHCVPFVEQIWAYSIGELIEMLPMDINNDGSFEDLLIHPNYHRWVVKYSGFLTEQPEYQSCMKELIDALYSMIVNLKEEGVI